jgi:hypothetical protein
MDSVVRTGVLLFLVPQLPVLLPLFLRYGVFVGLILVLILLFIDLVI